MAMTADRRARNVDKPVQNLSDVIPSIAMDLGVDHEA
jgi:hypothetical protein